MRTTHLTLLACCLAAAAHAEVKEYPLGKEIAQNGLTIAPNYLTGIQMEPMPKGMSMGPNTVHLEADIHASKGEAHGFAEGAWMPYLTVAYKLEKIGGGFSKTGTLLPMTAGDGPHYANNIDIGAPGQYRLTYTISPPSSNGFIRHVDKDTGVPAWWQPFHVTWEFTYPAQPKTEAEH